MESTAQSVRDLAARVARNFSPNCPVEDIAQDVVVSWLRQTSPPEDLTAWVATVTRNRVRDVMSPDRQRREGPAEDISSLVELGTRVYGPSAQSTDRDLLRRMLGELSAREAEMLLLSADGVEHAEIADIMGYASAASVATVLARTRRKLREANPERELILNPQRLY